MGMFDTAFAEITCPKCRHKQRADFQFKVYLGDYRPNLRDFEIGTSGLPKIPVLDVSAESDCSVCGAVHLAVLRFKRGTLAEIFFPRPDDFDWTPLPAGKNTMRRLAEDSYSQQRQDTLSVATQFLRKKMCSLGFARRILTDGNYAKIGGKWERIREY